MPNKFSFRREKTLIGSHHITGEKLTPKLMSMFAINEKYLCVSLSYLVNSEKLKMCCEWAGHMLCLWCDVTKYRDIAWHPNLTASMSWCHLTSKCLMTPSLENHVSNIAPVLFIAYMALTLCRSSVSPLHETQPYNTFCIKNFVLLTDLGCLPCLDECMVKREVALLLSNATKCSWRVSGCFSVAQEFRLAKKKLLNTFSVSFGKL